MKNWIEHSRGNGLRWFIVISCQNVSLKTVLSLSTVWKLVRCIPCTYTWIVHSVCFSYILYIAFLLISKHEKLWHENIARMKNRFNIDKAMYSYIYDPWACGHWIQEMVNSVPTLWLDTVSSWIQGACLKIMQTLSEERLCLPGCPVPWYLCHIVGMVGTYCVVKLGTLCLYWWSQWLAKYLNNICNMDADMLHSFFVGHSRLCLQPTNDQHHQNFIIQ